MNEFIASYQVRDNEDTARFVELALIIAEHCGHTQCTCEYINEDAVYVIRCVFDSFEKLKRFRSMIESTF